MPTSLRALGATSMPRWVTRRRVTRRSIVIACGDGLCSDCRLAAIGRWSWLESGRPSLRDGRADVPGSSSAFLVAELPKVTRVSKEEPHDRPGRWLEAGG